MHSNEFYESPAPDGSGSMGLKCAQVFTQLNLVLKAFVTAITHEGTSIAVADEGMTF